MDNSEEIKPREEVTWFAREMEKKLREKDYRGIRGWEKYTINFLLTRLREEVWELERCFTRTCKECGHEIKADNTKPIEEAADVANFAMMIADSLRKATP